MQIVEYMGCMQGTHSSDFRCLRIRIRIYTHMCTKIHRSVLGSNCPVACTPCTPCCPTATLAWPMHMGDSIAPLTLIPLASLIQVAGHLGTPDASTRVGSGLDAFVKGTPVASICTCGVRSGPFLSSHHGPRVALAQSRRACSEQAK